jgi:hypothetical protein
MPVPSNRRSGRQVGAPNRARDERLKATDSDPDPTWLTKPDSDMQDTRVQFLSNRPKLLREKRLL